jgi:L-alanine-DL-glutamate epimerase-like enolase superfamily enzyme
VVNRCGECWAALIRACRATPAASTSSRSTGSWARTTAQGFRAIKMKVGRASLREDVERVQAMRRKLGADFPLMADANMRWSADTAIRAARALRECELVWLEEPTIPDDVEGHARIVREGGVPIATGENLHTLYEFKQMIAAGGVTFPEPDVSNCGGVTVFMKVCALAEAWNLPVTSHGVHDLTVHLLAAAPNRSYLEIHGFGLGLHGRTDGHEGRDGDRGRTAGHGITGLDKLARTASPEAPAARRSARAAETCVERPISPCAS